MLSRFILSMILLLTASVMAEPGYDEALAKEVGADDYGMRPYVVAFLRKGPNRATDPPEAERLQRAHLDNIGRLAAEGRLSVAGPFSDDGELRGLYIFNVSSVEEARSLTESDPLIQSGGLVMELHPWYGPATLMLLPQWQAKVQKSKI